ncbi:MAG TPA: efflux RND transporter periplasmic adaptor subunit [Candidatus Hydrogenedentes bacterium]|nr:efflux RND transporter periplasmic adaptor subunit [Candidatus Hydrogenedentota bacterium]
MSRNDRAGRVRWGLLILLLVVTLAGYAGWRWWRGRGAATTTNLTATVIRGPLEITVVEGGTVEAKESQQIKSEVKGETKILSLVEEGYQVTEEDVANGKPLMTLDTKNLEDQRVAQELEFQNTLSALTEAQERYEIQLIDNESAIKTAELNVKFARMDLAKYVGEALAAEITEALEQRVNERAKREEARRARRQQQPGAGTSASFTEATSAKNNSSEKDAGNGREGESEPRETSGTNGSEVSTPETSSTPAVAPDEMAGAAAQETYTVSLDLTPYLDPSRYGDGDAMQKMRQLENDVALARQDLGLAETKLEGTRRLFAKDFVTKNQLDNDELAYNRKQVTYQAAETSKALFLKYELPKQVEKLVSDYEQAMRSLDRARKRAVSELAQAESRLNSARMRHLLQKQKLDDTLDQLAKCVIRATRPGMVLYGTGERTMGGDVIEEGATVRERQVLITIPDTSAMTVKVRIHEAFVEQIQPGQEARIKVDARPTEVLKGRVSRISVLPDPQNRWMNPELKVYTTVIDIEGSYSWLRPGMTASAEIITRRLEDVTQVPLQAVYLEDGQAVCYVKQLTGYAKRPVKTGAFSSALVEILEGLQPGEQVLLEAPGSQEDTGNGQAEPENDAPGKRKKGEEAGMAAGKVNGS